MLHECPPPTTRASAARPTLTNRAHLFLLCFCSSSSSSSGGDVRVGLPVRGIGIASDDLRRLSWQVGRCVDAPLRPSCSGSGRPRGLPEGARECRGACARGHGTSGCHVRYQTRFIWNVGYDKCRLEAAPRADRRRTGQCKGHLAWENQEQRQPDHLPHRHEKPQGQCTNRHNAIQMLEGGRIATRHAAS